MNWGAAAVVLSFATLLATIIGAAYTHGKLTQRVDQSEEKIKGHDEILRGHDERLADHDVALGRFSEWKEGFNAASRVSATREVH